MMVEGRGEGGSLEKEAHKAMCQNSAEENRRSYNGMKNKEIKFQFQLPSFTSNEREDCRGA